MRKLPRVAGLILCKRMEVNPSKVEMSLAGLFTSLSFSSWPAPAPPFTVYAALYDGLGEGRIELILTRLETERDVYVHTKWIAFSDRQVLVHLETRVRKCEFPAPGRYALALRFDERELARRYLDIKQAKEVSDE